MNNLTNQGLSLPLFMVRFPACSTYLTHLLESLLLAYACGKDCAAAHPYWCVVFTGDEAHSALRAPTSGQNQSR